MPELGKKFTCYSCHTKFYDLGKSVPLCPKCGADQRDADEAPVAPTPRSRTRVVVEPIEEPEFGAEEAPTDDEEEDIIEEAPVQEEPEEVEEEEEY